jgi:hypothetical protein
MLMFCLAQHVLTAPNVVFPIQPSHLLLLGQGRNKAVGLCQVCHNRWQLAAPQACLGEICCSLDMLPSQYLQCALIFQSMSLTVTPRRYQDLESQANAASGNVMPTNMLVARDDALMQPGDASLLVAYLDLLT